MPILFCPIPIVLVLHKKGTTIETHIPHKSSTRLDKPCEITQEPINVDGMLTELRTDLCKLGIVMSSTVQSQPLSRFVFPREKKHLKQSRIRSEVILGADMTMTSFMLKLLSERLKT